MSYSPQHLHNHSNEICDKELKITKTSRFSLQKHLLRVHNVTKDKLLNVQLKNSKYFDILKCPFRIRNSSRIIF